MALCMKKEVRIVLSIFILILLIPFVYSAANKIYNYNTNQVKLIIYPCLDYVSPNCNSVSSTNWFNQASGSSSSITIIGEPSSTNIEYHFREGYLPQEVAGTPLNWYNSGSLEVSLSKQSICSSTISNTQVLGTKEVNNALTITANLPNVLTQLAHNSNFIPSGYEAYYTATTTVRFYVDNIEVTSQRITKEIPLNGDSVTFTYTPTQAKDYNFSIETDVTDNQCSDKSLQSGSKIITITQPAQQCQENWQCGYPYYNSGNNTWSTCANNIQSRVCSDLNNCGTTNNKPAPTQSCTT